MRWLPKQTSYVMQLLPDDEITIVMHIISTPFDVYLYSQYISQRINRENHNKLLF